MTSIEVPLGKCRSYSLFDFELAAVVTLTDVGIVVHLAAFVAVAVVVYVVDSDRPSSHGKGEFVDAFDHAQSTD